MSKRKHKKAANGTGSIVDLPDGRYRAFASLGTRPDGRPYRRSKICDTKGEAQAWVRKQLTELDEGTFTIPSDITVAGLIEQWELSNPHWTKATRDDNIGTLTRHVIPHLGDKQVVKLRPADIQALINLHRSNGRTQSSVHRIANRFSACLTFAVRLEIITRNPAKGIKAPKRPPRGLTRWSAEETRLMLAACRQDDSTTARYLYTALTTGMRKEELRGLRWKDVNLGKLHLTVRHVAVNEGRIVMREKTKTEAGHRVIHFDAGTQAMLLAQLDAQAELRKNAGERWQDHDLVFASRNGTPLHNAVLRRNTDRLMKAAGVKTRIRLYDTRSTHGSLLAEQGVNPKAISERLGHTDVAFTMQVYVRPAQEEQKQIAQMMGALGGEQPCATADAVPLQVDGQGATDSAVQPAETPTEPESGTSVN